MSAVHGDEWHQIGKHFMRFEAPDVVHMRVVGDLTLLQVSQMFELANSFPNAKRGFFNFVDLFDAGRPNLEILKSNEILKQMAPYRAFIYYRAEFKHRTVIEIVQKVSRALKLPLSTKPIVAFATEAEARTWVDDYRHENA